MKARVFVAMPLAADHLKMLQEHCEVEVFSGTPPITRDNLIAGIAGADAVVGSAQLRFPAEVLDRAPRLRAICNVGVGYDNVDLSDLTARGITIANTPGVLSDAVADLVMGLMITVARRLRDSEAIVREGRWGRAGTRIQLGVDLRGKTLSIIGMGRIGREVASRAAAFKMRIVAFDTRGDIELPSFVDRAGTLDEALSAGDFVSLHVDLNASTRHLIGVRELALMKPTAFFFNTARGPIVEQPALYQALVDKRIAGAALDVLEVEPPDAAEPLLQLDNVFVVPHIGSATVETRAAMLDLALSNLIACLSGGECANIVNPEALAARVAEAG